jgi:hypothetical protein
MSDPQSTGPSAFMVGNDGTQESKEGDCDAPQPQLKEISEWNTPLICCTDSINEQ